MLSPKSSPPATPEHGSENEEDDEDEDGPSPAKRSKVKAEDEEGNTDYPVASTSSSLATANRSSPRKGRTPKKT